MDLSSGEATLNTLLLPDSDSSGLPLAQSSNERDGEFRDSLTAALDDNSSEFEEPADSDTGKESVLIRSASHGDKQVAVAETQHAVSESIHVNVNALDSNPERQQQRGIAAQPTTSRAGSEIAVENAATLQKPGDTNRSDLRAGIRSDLSNVDAELSQRGVTHQPQTDAQPNQRQITTPIPAAVQGYRASEADNSSVNSQRSSGQTAAVGRPEVAAAVPRSTNVEYQQGSGVQNTVPKLAASESLHASGNRAKVQPAVPDSTSIQERVSNFERVSAKTPEQPQSVVSRDAPRTATATTDVGGSSNTLAGSVDTLSATQAHGTSPRSRLSSAFRFIAQKVQQFANKPPSTEIEKSATAITNSVQTSLAAARNELSLSTTEPVTPPTSGFPITAREFGLESAARLKSQSSSRSALAENVAVSTTSVSRTSFAEGSESDALTTRTALLGDSDSSANQNASTPKLSGANDQINSRVDQISQSAMASSGTLNATRLSSAERGTWDPTGIAAVVPSANPVASVSGATNFSGITDPFGSVVLDLNDSKLPARLTQNIVAMAERGVQSATLRVNPAELGPVQIDIVTDREQLAVTIAATQQHTRELLESSLFRLRDQLSDESFRQVDVQVGQQSRQQGQAHGEPGAERQSEQPIDNDASQTQLGDSSDMKNSVQTHRRGDGSIDAYV